jgi:predicted nucleic acid-binding protein
MTALFADTFYWVALADVRDAAHRWALALTAERATSRLVTTDEVLGEYLTFFATASVQLRRQAAESVECVLASSVISCNSAEPRVVSGRATSLRSASR